MTAVDTLLFWDHTGRQFRTTGNITGASSFLAEGPKRWDLRTDSPANVTLTVEALPVVPGVLSLTMSSSHPALVAELGAALPAGADEHFYGLGERFGPLDLAGQVLLNWSADQIGQRGRGPTSYAPTPFLLSSRGYGLLLDTTARAEFDFRADGRGTYQVRAEGNRLRVLLIAGPHPQTVLERHARIVGLPPLPPRWAFGVWKNVLGGQERVLQDVAQLRREGVPVDALWIYDAVADGTDFGWPWQIYGPVKPGSYPGLAGLIARLQQQGLKILGYLNPFLYPDSAGYAEADAQGFLVSGLNGAPFVEDWSLSPRSYLDFTDPRATAWWQGRLHRALTAVGFDGAMLDFGDGAPVEARYANGESGALMHNRYPVLYHRATYEAAESAKPGDAVFFARAGYSGSQPYTTGRFTGDQDRSWDRHEGLPSALTAMLSGGLSGWPYVGPDIAGFFNRAEQRDGESAADRAERRRAEKELWIRWVQLGALSPTMRDMNGAMRDPITVWTDGDTLAVFRAYARLHAALMPYLYRYAEVAHARGVPIVRPLFLNYPTEAVTYELEDEYLLGDDLLVAPVLRPGQAERRCYLPTGRWRDFWTGLTYQGPGWTTVAAPLERIPLFVREGSTLDLPSPDTLAQPEDRRQ